MGIVKLQEPNFMCVWTVILMGPALGCSYALAGTLGSYAVGVCHTPTCASMETNTFFVFLGEWSTFEHIQWFLFFFFFFPLPILLPIVLLCSAYTCESISKWEKSCQVGRGNQPLLSCTSSIICFSVLGINKRVSQPPGENVMEGWCVYSVRDTGLLKAILSGRY